MKKSKRCKEAHCANTKYGMGDYYGTGIKNPIGRVREDYMGGNISPKKIKQPPKSLA